MLILTFRGFFMRIEAIFVAPFVAAPVLLLLVFWVLIITSGKRRR